MGHRAAPGSGVTAGHGARRDGSAPAAGPKPAADARTGGLAELVLAGLVVDEDELLGDLTEERAHREATYGGGAARSWYRRQAVRAVPHLLWRGLRTRFGWVALGVVGALAVNLAVRGSLGPTGLFDSRYTPTTQEVLGDTIVHGVVILLGGLLAGAVAALLSRGARLVPVVIVAAFCSLWAWHGPFYAIYGPARLTSSTVDGTRVFETYSVELGAWSQDLVLPALWQLPTMSILMPTVTLLGGLAAVAWTRQRASRDGSDPA
jgi:hypothetical protein